MTVEPTLELKLKSHSKLMASLFQRQHGEDDREASIAFPTFDGMKYKAEARRKCCHLIVTYMPTRVTWPGVFSVVATFKYKVFKA